VQKIVEIVDGDTTFDGDTVGFSVDGDDSRHLAEIDEVPGGQSGGSETVSGSDCFDGFTGCHCSRNDLADIVG
jgi:hypothetical protein